jgi:HTH-type transcriptional regulator / antitoxin HigA
MQAAIDNRKYGRLLTKIMPRKIETEEQNERYLQVVETLMDKGAENFSPEEHALFDLLITLIEDFEAKAYPMPDVKPHERLKYILEEKGLRQKDLVTVFGSEGVVSDTISGRRPISLKTARNLSVLLNVPVELFI